MKPRILQNGRLLPAVESALAAEFDAHPLWREADPAAFLAAQGARFEGPATSARFGADARLSWSWTAWCCCRASPAPRTGRVARWAS